MSNILILGAGVMGTAIAVPALENGHHVTLVGTHLDDEIIKTLKASRKHPKLSARLSGDLTVLNLSQLDSVAIDDAELVIIGVSSPGIDWAVQTLGQFTNNIPLLALVTKGLQKNEGAAALTYAETIESMMKKQDVSLQAFVAIGGPCIANELANRKVTSVVFASEDAVALEHTCSLMKTDYYRIHQSDDVIGVEACAALKNFFTIGVSTTLGEQKNPTAALFNQAVQEMMLISQWLGGEPRTATDLAGLGDLHVTVGGGRNSRLGQLLGEGLTIAEALQGPLKGETVEGRDTGLVLSLGLRKAVDRAELMADKLPLALAILDCIEKDSVFEFDYTKLG